MKKTLIIILHLYGFIVYGQNTSTIIQLDVCMGETITLAPENILSITWDNGSTEHSIVEQITSNTTFSALVVKKENNLAENGDFELGNSLFSSSYSYWPGSNLLFEGMYHVSDNPRTSHSGLVACTDHTTGSGNMAIYNGASSANVEVWSQTIDVEQNTEYALSAWIQKINGQIPGNPAMLQFKINGVLIGDIFRTSEIACEWGNFYEIWDSETNTQATISIVNQNTALSGNDFAIDDISFSEISSIRYIYEITAIPLPEINIGNDTLVCGNYTIDAGVDFDSYLWNNNSTNQTLEVSTTGIYSVEVSKNNCTSSDEIEITVSNPFILNLGNDTTICENTTISIYLESADSYLWNDGTSNSAFSTSEAGIYSVTLTRGACSSSDTIEIFVQPLPIIDFGQTSITKCEVDSVEINCGYSNAHYLWNTGDTTQTIKIKNEGTYFITVTDNNCEEFGTIQVINNPSTYPSISIGVSSTQICEGESINIYISDSSNLGLNPNIILLKNGSTFPFTNNSSIENIANNDIFRLIATSTLECSISDTVSSYTKITVIETPVPQTNINNQRICEYETPATFTALGSNIKWYQVDDTTTTPIHTGANYTPTINTPGNYKFYATQTQYLCQSSTAEVNFNVYQKPESIIIDDNKGCEFSSHTLKIHLQILEEILFGLILQMKYLKTQMKLILN
jgi:hypothetical protein